VIHWQRISFDVADKLKKNEVIVLTEDEQEDIRNEFQTQPGTLCSRVPPKPICSPDTPFGRESRGGDRMWQVHLRRDHQAYSRGRFVCSCPTRVEASVARGGVSNRELEAGPFRRPPQGHARRVHSLDVWFYTQQENVRLERVVKYLLLTSVVQDHWCFGIHAGEAEVSALAAQRAFPVRHTWLREERRDDLLRFHSHPLSALAAEATRKANVIIQQIGASTAGVRTSDAGSGDAGKVKTLKKRSASDVPGDEPTPKRPRTVGTPKSAAEASIDT
jgi:hypothetical protein